MKNHEQVISGIALDQDAVLRMEQCELRGNLAKATVGVLSRWADVSINNCVVYDYSEGGLIIQGHKLNHIQVLSLSRSRTVVSKTTINLAWI